MLFSPKARTANRLVITLLLALGVLAVEGHQMLAQSTFNDPQDFFERGTEQFNREIQRLERRQSSAPEDPLTIEPELRTDEGELPSIEEPSVSPEETDSVQPQLPQESNTVESN